MLFQRQNVVTSELRLPVVPLVAQPVLLSPPARVEPPRLGEYERVYFQLMERYGPPSLVIRAQYNVIYYAEGVKR